MDVLMSKTQNGLNRFIGLLLLLVSVGALAWQTLFYFLKD